MNTQPDTTTRTTAAPSHNEQELWLYLHPEALAEGPLSLCASSSPDTEYGFVPACLGDLTRDLDEQARLLALHAHPDGGLCPWFGVLHLADGAYRWDDDEFEYVRTGDTPAGAAADDGPGAMYQLARLLEVRGEYAEAEELYRLAAESGDGFAIFDLGRVLENHAKYAEAESWYRYAAENGDTIAASNLGRLLENRGEDAEAEELYREAAEDGVIPAMYDLYRLLCTRGEDAEAKRWRRQAIDNDYDPAGW